MRSLSARASVRIAAAAASAACVVRSEIAVASVRAVLDILIERDRIALVPDIARAFGDLVDRREGVVHAKIATSVELSERERGDVVRQLERASGKTIKATFTVDPRLIGGARVQVGDRLVDASLRAKLESLSRELASS